MINHETYYVTHGQNDCVLKRLNYIPKARDISKNKHKIYKKVYYISEGKRKSTFLSISQINDLKKSKSLDMELFIGDEKRYISSVLFDIYLFENEHLISFD